MSNAELEPAWLRGETRSWQREARVQRWEHEESRQFMVLPFYENDVVVRGAERYMLWGRALSDGRMYPIPPEWYVMRLAFEEVYPPGAEATYRWICMVADWVSGGVGQAKLVLNTMAAVIDDKNCTARLCVHESCEIISPEPIQRSLGTPERPATVFYPDAGLWSVLPRLPYQPGDLESPFGLEPDGLDAVGSAYCGVFGPVETFWSGVQDIQIRPVSTELWNRRDAPDDLIECPHAQTPSSARGGV